MRVTKMENYLSDNPTFTYTALPVTSYYAPYIAEQPGGSVTVFPNTTTTQVQYRNGHLVTAMASGTAADGYSYPKGLYYQIDVSSGTPTLLQEGVIDPGYGVAVQMPSVDEDINGNLGFTWIQSSSSEYLSMYVGTLSTAGNFASTAAAPGGGFFPDNFRLGDYSTTVLDPSDGVTFWSANQYIGADGYDNIWKTKIVGFQVAPTNSSDWYSVVVTENGVLNVSTGIPSSGLGEFVNRFDPIVRVYDESGALVAEDDNSADGRNAMLELTGLAEGRYYIVVGSADGSKGEYTLSATTTAAEMAGLARLATPDAFSLGSASALKNARRTRRRQHRNRRGLRDFEALRRLDPRDPDNPGRL